MTEDEDRFEEYYELKRIDRNDSNPFKGCSGIPWQTQAKFWLLIAAGIAMGTFLFLFFMTLFIYFFLPLFAVFLLWSLFRRWRRGW